MAVKGQRTSYTVHGPQGVVEANLKKSYADKLVESLNWEHGGGYYTSHTVTTGNLRCLVGVLEEAGMRLR